VPILQPPNPRTQGSTCKDNDIESVEVQVVTEPIAVEEVQQDSISFDDATKHDRYNKLSKH